ncbi:MAG: HIT domain-containing protein [Rickettsiales bacterium]|jgi:diadenosine tetraphosphate (Ap4A) HIT family hydrolase|nr:HIT domain-containing protein [Rickettsiales bacterium]
MYDPNNVFAKVLRGELPCKKIYENEFAMSFHDINPAARVHALVIPRGEYKNIMEFTANASAMEQAGFWDAVTKTAAALDISDGFRLSSHIGAAGGQTVFHFHAHMMADDRMAICRL